MTSDRPKFKSKINRAPKIAIAIGGALLFVIYVFCEV
jgi:hypothetical protein